MSSPHPLLEAETQSRYRELGHWADLTIADVVQDRAAREPERLAIAGEHPLRYAELWERSSRLAGSLAQAWVAEQGAASAA